MTRINTVSPQHLTDQWLIAEWRELPRIVNELEKHPQRFDLKKIPKNYTLNKGHVTFFRDKLLYLAKRHRDIRKELKRRKISHNKKIKVNLYYLMPHLKWLACNDWEPSKTDHSILIDRLIERFNLRKKPYYITSDNKKLIIDCDHTFDQYFNKNLSNYLL